MKIINSTGVKNLVDIGLEKDFLASDEISDFLPQNIFSPEEIEDAFDFLSESDIDVVGTIQEKVEPREEESAGWGDAQKSSSERPDNIIWAYLKDIGHVSLLTPDEDLRIAKKIEEGERTAKNILF